MKMYCRHTRVLLNCSTVYNQDIVYKYQNFLKVHVVVHVIIIDQCNHNANSADPDQMLQNAASDQGLHYLLKIQKVKG